MTDFKKEYTQFIPTLKGLYEAIIEPFREMFFELRDLLK